MHTTENQGRLTLRTGDKVLSLEYAHTGTVLAVGAGRALVRMDLVDAVFVYSTDALALAGVAAPEGDAPVWDALGALVNIGLADLPESATEARADLLRRVGIGDGVDCLAWADLMGTPNDGTREMFVSDATREAAAALRALGTGPNGLFTQAAADLDRMNASA